jgi:hypothetical protein
LTILLLLFLQEDAHPAIFVAARVFESPEEKMGTLLLV